VANQDEETATIVGELLVRDRADIVAPPVGEAVCLAEIGWGSVVDGERSIDVDGVTVGMSSGSALTVEVDPGIGTVRASATHGSDDAFWASLAVSSRRTKGQEMQIRTPTGPGAS
jgi:hypothetical protein